MPNAYSSYMCYLYIMQEAYRNGKMAILVMCEQLMYCHLTSSCSGNNKSCYLRNQQVRVKQAVHGKHKKFMINIYICKKLILRPRVQYFD